VRSRGSKETKTWKQCVGVLQRNKYEQKSWTEVQSVSFVWKIVTVLKAMNVYL